MVHQMVRENKNSKEKKIRLDAEESAVLSKFLDESQEITQKPIF